MDMVKYEWYHPNDKEHALLASTSAEGSIDSQ